MSASEDPNWVEHHFGFPRTPQSARDDITRGCRQLLSGKPYSLVSVQHLSGNGFVSDRLLSGRLLMVSSVKVHIVLVGAPMAAPWRLVSVVCTPRGARDDLGGTPRGAKDDLASHWTQRQITVANAHNSHRAPTDGDCVDMGEGAGMGMKMCSSKRTGPMSPSPMMSRRKMTP